MALSSPEARSTHLPSIPVYAQQKNASSLAQQSPVTTTMRQLIRRLSRVGDCSPPPPSSSEQGRRRGARGNSKHAGVPEGHVPVHVGGGAEGAEERFLVRAELLGAPALADLLGRAAQEYGYRHHGPLRIPCPAAVFRRALAEVSSSVAADGDDDDEEEGA